MTSQERVKKVLKGENPDHVPTFDALRSKTLIEYLSGCKLTEDNKRVVTHKALGNGFDAIWNIKYPQKPHSEIKGGFTYEVQEWTEWIKKRPFSTSEECAKFMKTFIEKADTHKIDSSEIEIEKIRNDNLNLQKELGDCIYPIPTEVGFDCFSFGIELFAYTYADYPEIVSKYLKTKNQIAVNQIIAFADSNLSPLAIEGHDIAYNKGLLFSPQFLRKNFIPYLERTASACHTKGLTHLPFRWLSYANPSRFGSCWY